MIDVGISLSALLFGLLAGYHIGVYDQKFDGSVSRSFTFRGRTFLVEPMWSDEVNKDLHENADH